jgi:hypothetical protein
MEKKDRKPREKYGALYRIAQRIFPLLPLYNGSKDLLSIGHSIYYYYDRIEHDEDFPKFLQPYQVQRIYQELELLGDVRRFGYAKQGKGYLYIRVPSESDVFA